MKREGTDFMRVCVRSGDCPCYSCVEGRARSWRRTSIVLTFLCGLQVLAHFAR